ncbi:MAG: OsmC family protein [Armatimonadetes bacterium]|nr:OsmC family protein [Armatimonadota bacterium]
MPSELKLHAHHDGDMRVVATARGQSVTMDYPLTSPETAGMTPLETLLAAVAGCATNTIALLLARSGQSLTGFETEVTAQRRDEHPTVLTSISVEFVLHGQVDEAIAARIIDQAQHKLCPVWAMIQPTTPISVTWRVV